MMGRPYVLADFSINDPLSEYFSKRGFELDFIPKNLDVPLIDFIYHRIKNKKNVFIILSTKHDHQSPSTDYSLTKLFNEKSIYHNSSDLARSGSKLILYDKNDCLLNLYRYDDDETSDFVSWLNQLNPYVFADGIPGRWVLKRYRGCRFIELGNFFTSYEMAYPELSIFKDHAPKKDFLCLMCKAPKRSHRALLHQQMTDRALVDHTIYKFSTRGEHTHEDLRDSFPEETIQLWKDGVPPIQHYNNSNIEIVAEALGHHNHDESFYLTEKTVKPISMKHPFMVLSSFNFLGNLKNLGFKTFGDHIDESYDHEMDVNERIKIIIKNLDNLKGKSMKFYNDTLEIREHNLWTLQIQIGVWKTKLWKKVDEFFKNV